MFEACFTRLCRGERGNNHVLPSLNDVACSNWDELEIFLEDVFGNFRCWCQQTNQVEPEIIEIETPTHLPDALLNDGIEIPRFCSPELVDVNEKIEFKTHVALLYRQQETLQLVQTVIDSVASSLFQDRLLVFVIVLKRKREKLFQLKIFHSAFESLAAQQNSLIGSLYDCSTKRFPFDRNRISARPRSLGFLSFFFIVRTALSIIHE